MNKTVMTMLPR